MIVFGFLNFVGLLLLFCSQSHHPCFLRQCPLLYGIIFGFFSWNKDSSSQCLQLKYFNVRLSGSHFFSLLMQLIVNIIVFRSESQHTPRTPSKASKAELVKVHLYKSLLKLKLLLLLKAKAQEVAGWSLQVEIVAFCFVRAQMWNPFHPTKAGAMRPWPSPSWVAASAALAELLGSINEW